MFIAILVLVSIVTGFFIGYGWKKESEKTLKYIPIDKYVLDRFSKYEGKTVFYRDYDNRIVETKIEGFSYAKYWQEDKITFYLHGDAGGSVDPDKVKFTLAELA